MQPFGGRNPEFWVNHVYLVFCWMGLNVSFVFLLNILFLLPCNVVVNMMNFLAAHMVLFHSIIMNKVFCDHEEYFLGNYNKIGKQLD